MSYLQVPLDDAEDPPLSPWRTRAKEHTRRSAMVRRVIMIAASLAFAVPLLLLLHYVREDHTYTASISPDILQPHSSSSSIHHLNLTAESTSSLLPASPSPSPSSSTAPPPVQTTHSLSSNSTSIDPVVFSLIMWSTDSAKEGAILVKVSSDYVISLGLALTNCPVDHYVQFHPHRDSYHL